MEIGTYLLLLSKKDNYLIDNLKVMGGFPCYSFPTLQAAKQMKERLEKETVYKVTIVQIIT